MHLGRDNAGRRLDAMRPRRFDLTEVLEGGGESDDAVAAHRQISGVVEKDHCRGVRRIRRGTQKRADERLVTARLVDDRAAKAIEGVAKTVAALGDRASAEVRTAFDDDACRLAGGVAIDD